MRSKTHNRDHSDKGKWSKADRINACGAFIALLGLAVGVLLPDALHGLAFIMRPQVSFSWPTPNARMTNATFGASGTAHRIPAGYDLWLVVRPPLAGKWYPVEPLHFATGSWHVPGKVICPGPGVEQLVIYQISEFDDRPLYDYYNSSAETVGTGIENMPLDSVVRATETVQVPANARC
jgi:hypothetical protein